MINDEGIDVALLEELQKEIYEETEQLLIEKYEELGELQTQKEKAQEEANKLEFEKLKKQINIDPSKINPLHLARKVGYSILGSVGADVFEEMELTYLSRILSLSFNPQTLQIELRKFDNNSSIRPYQNLLLYWQKGWLKSTILDIFCSTIPQEYPHVKLSGMSKEMILGSIDSEAGRLIVPPFTNKIFGFISELTAFVGEGEQGREFANKFNDILEGTEVSRILVKLSKKINNEEMIRVKNLGVKFTPLDSTMQYVPKTCFFAASKPLNPKTFTQLYNDGFMGRFHIIQPVISDKQVEEFFTNPVSINEKELDLLKHVNKVMSLISVKELNLPSDAYQKELLKVIFVRYKEIIKDLDVDMSEFISLRVKGDILRELVAHAFSHQIKRQGKLSIDKIMYKKEDFDYIHKRADHFLVPLLFPKISKSFFESFERPMRIVLLGILKVLNKKGEMSREDLKAEVFTNEHITSVNQFNNGIKILFDRKLITKPKYGFYQITKEGITILLNKIDDEAF